MEAAESAFHDLVKKFLSWIGQRAETSTMSRDFWMPDQSCPVCYECDSPFSLFNRRHHCRICGRIFCGKCTLNTLPAVDGRANLHEQGERVRVCNFCFKLSQEDGQNEAKSFTPTLTPSSSSFSLASSSTSGSSSSSSGNSGQLPTGYGFRAPTVTRIELNADMKQRIMTRAGRRTLRSLSPSGRELSPNPYDFCSNRSEDDEGDSKVVYHNSSLFEARSPEEEEDQSHIETKLSDVALKCSSDNFTQYSIDYIPKIGDTGDDNRDGNDIPLKKESVATVERTLSKRSGMSSDDYEVPDESVDESNFYAPSLFQDTTPGTREEPVDVENNPSIWIAPPPEDEDDDMEMSLVDDDDDDEEGGWGSISSSEYRNREKAAASHEQRKAMRAVVDGHFRALVEQLLDGEGMRAEEDEKESWPEIVTSLALQAASLVKPDTSKDGGMDPGGYVKVKCVATGRRSESCVVKGVVCKRNVAHRRMTSRFKNPKLLLLGGSLEYQRVPNLLSSLDTLLQQEKDHLSMTVSRIEAHHPNVVLVEKTISRQAQEKLFSKEISFVLNVKRPLLDRISRCTGAEIVPSPDHLIKSKSGQCELFHVEKYVEELGSAGQGGKKLPKTLMFFEGCPRPLGCTVLLKGANGDELKRIKRVVQYAVFAAYQLALETSFLVDEGATLPELSFKSPISVALPDKQLKSDRSISTVPGFLLPAPGSTTGDSQTQPVQAEPSCTSLSISPPQFISIPSWGNGGTKMSGAVVSAPWSVTSSSVSSRTNSPSTSPRAVNAQETLFRGFGNKQFNINNLNMSLPEMVNPPVRNFTLANIPGSQVSGVSGLSISLKQAPVGNMSYSSAHGERSLKPAPDKVCNMDSKLLRRHNSGTGSPRISPKSVNPCYAEADGPDIAKPLVKMNSDMSICQSPLFAAPAVVQDGFRWVEQDANQEDFPPSPSDHQSIPVSFSSCNLNKGTVCAIGQLYRIKYYGSFDKPLGRFLRDDVFDLNLACKFCEERREAHVHCYTHQQGSLTISVHHQNQVLTGQKDGKIWMWHRCLKCPRTNNVPPATGRVVMSDAAWGLSFGKFLELSFSNHAAASRVASCGHSLHRDCLRFYGCGSMVACFRYAPINVHSVYLPPHKLEFNNPELYDWLTNEVSEVTGRGDLFFANSFARLRFMEENLTNYGSCKTPEARRRTAECESLLRSDMSAFKETLEKAAPLEREPGHMFADILQLNSTRRTLAACSMLWDVRFHYLFSFLRLRRSNPICVSANLDDPSIVLRTKDPSFLDKSWPLEGEETRNNTVFDTSESSKPTQIKTHQVSRQVGASLCNGIVQSSDQVSKHEIDTANDLLLNNNEDNAKPFDYTYCNHSPEGSGKGKKDTTFIDCNTSENESLLLSNKLFQDRDVAIMAGGSESNSFIKEKGKDCSFGIAEDKASVHSNIWKDDHANILKDDLLVRRTFSEGQFPILPDLSDTFEAAWTGKGHTIEAHAVKISSSGQEIVSHSSGLDTTSGESASLNSAGFEASSDVIAEYPLKSGLRNSSSLYDMGGLVSDGLMTSTPTSPAKNGDRSDNVGAWIGTPFSSLYRSYSRGSENISAGSPPRTDSQWLSSSSAVKRPDGEARIFLPMGIDNTVIPVYDDEPTSIIAYAIMSHQYQAHLSDRPGEKEKWKERDKEKDQKREKDKKKNPDFTTAEAVVSHPLQIVEGPLELSELASKDKIGNYEEILPPSSKEGANNGPLYSKAMHVKVSFTDDGNLGKVKYMVTCYYAKQFDALRKKCCSDQMEFIRSLCRCKKWGAQGGKSNVFFAKTADDRFVIKQVTKTELESFIKFAPDYFNYLSDAVTSGSPTCLAKILGIFQVTIKHGKGGRELRMDLMVMENLLYGRHVTRLYDLKGSVRSRYNSDATGKNKVLLDENLLEAMLSNPIFIGAKAKRILERAVWNDTSFLAAVDVMDYSLLVGVDEERRELVIGIIDFMRQYTWDKHLETWVKASGILGGPKNAPPTVISPKQYKKRFRKAMKAYFVMVPDQSSPPTETFGPSHVDSAIVESYPSMFQDEPLEDNFNVKI